MSGLFGFAPRTLGRPVDPRPFFGMGSILVHDESQVVEVLSGIPPYVGQVGQSKQDPGSASANGDCCTWIFGSMIVPGEGSSAAWLAEMYGSRSWPDCLGECGGIFSVVIIDRRAQTVHLATDGLGLRHVYWMMTGAGLFFGPEPKIALTVDGFEASLSDNAVQDFFVHGHLFGDQTWIKGVRLLDRASVLSYSLLNGEVTIARYDFLGDSEKRAPSLQESAHECERLFRIACDRLSAVSDNQKVGVLLSGGLDSRAVLACVADSSTATVTYGKSGAVDEKIASRVAEALSVPHVFFQLGASDWLLHRIAGVWRTDGQSDMYHMHGVEVLKDMRAHMTVNMSGLAGDAVLGGSWLWRRDWLDRWPNAEAIRQLTGGQVVNDQEAAGYQSIDDYMLSNRVRRFTCEGMRLFDVGHEWRAPFIDRDLLAFVRTLPDDYRYGGVLYRHMLMSLRSELFKQIPWQRTGVAVGAPMPVRLAHRVAGGLTSRAGRILPLIGMRTYAARSRMYDYPRWLSQPGTLSLVKRLLCSKDSIHAEILGRAPATGLIDGLERGKDTSGDVLRLLTIEVWARQFLRGELRSQSTDELRSALSLKC